MPLSLILTILILRFSRLTNNHGKWEAKKAAVTKFLILCCLVTECSWWDSANCEDWWCCVKSESQTLEGFTGNLDGKTSSPSAERRFLQNSGMNLFFILFFHWSWYSPWVTWRFTQSNHFEVCDFPLSARQGSSGGPHPWDGVVLLYVFCGGKGLVQNQREPCPQEVTLYFLAPGSPHTGWASGRDATSNLNIIWGCQEVGIGQEGNEAEFCFTS